MGYPVKSDEEVKVRLTVRYLDDRNASQAVAQVVGLAGTALTAGVVPVPLSSVFKSFQVPPVNTQVQDLQTKLGQFKQITTISTTATLKYERKDDSFVGFSYHFVAPNQPATDVVKLAVQLRYQNSLLTGGDESASSNLGDIANKRIHKELASFPRLVDFVAQDPAFMAVWGTRSSANLQIICNAIKNSFGEKLVAADSSLGLEAFIASRSGEFSPIWNPECYSEEDVTTLKRLRPNRPLTFAYPTRFDPENASRVSFEEQIKQYLESARILLKASRPDLSNDLSRDAILLRRQQMNDQLGTAKIQLTGVAPFFGAGYSDEDYDAGGLYSILMSIAVPTVGCYWRDAYSVPTDPNVGTLLSEKDNKIYAHKISFEKTTTEGRKVRPLRWDIFEAQAELMNRYKAKFPSGCTESGWRPWARAPS